MTTQDWFKKYQEEITQKPDMGEIEWRSLFIEQVIKRGLGWPAKLVRNEKGNTDIRIFDETGFSYLVFETKKDDKKLNLKKTVEQAQSYLQGGEILFILASPKRLRLFSPTGELRGDLLLNEQCPEDALFWQLHYQRLQDKEHLKTFREGEFPSAFIPIDKYHPKNFDKFVHALRLCSDLLSKFAYPAWKQNEEWYAEYQEKSKEVKKQREDLERNRPAMSLSAYEDRDRPLREKELEIHFKYRGPREIFEHYWPEFRKIQPYSRDVRDKEKELLNIYLTDVSYIALSRILFIRICEDKQLIKPKISNGGLKAWKMLTTKIEKSYPDLLKVAYSDTSREVYAPLFEGGIFEWYTWQNGLLSETLEKIFFLLNSFNLSKIDRDTLGDLYQEFLPKEKRKKMGEFYTPIEVVDYILKHTNWPKEGLFLDPACGSGTFLVRAGARLLDRLEKSGISPAERLRALDSVIGLDINPFAVYIAQMNLLFLVLDDYLAVREKDPQYRLKHLPVYATDSLSGTRKYTNDDLFTESSDEAVEKAVKLRDALETYSWIVMNPPYVRNERLPEGKRSIYRKTFSDVTKGNADIFTYFLRKAIDWLKDDGRLGVIVSLGLCDADATKELRSFLNQFIIERIVPLEWADVFIANVNPILLFIRKKKPRSDQKIKFVPGVHKLSDLKKNNLPEFEILQHEWINLAPDESWRVEILPEDIPVLKKLCGLNKIKLENNSSQNILEARYGITLGGQADEQIIISEDKTILENPYPIIDGREIKAWSLEWQGRYIDYVTKYIRDPKDLDFFAPPKLLLQRISLTTQAVVDETNTMFRDTVMKIIPLLKNDILTPYILSAVINSIPIRYYTFLMLRNGVIQKGFSNFVPRVINSFPVPELAYKDKKIAQELETSSRNAHKIAKDLVNWDTDAKNKLTSLLSGKLKPLAQTEDADFTAYFDPIIVSEAEVKKNVLQGNTLSKISGKPKILEYILYRAELDGLEELNKTNLEQFPVPSEKNILTEALKILISWAEEKEKVIQSLKKVETEINNIILDSFEILAAKEKKHILKRCKQFPLSEVLVTPIPGSPVRKIGIKKYLPGERYK